MVVLARLHSIRSFTRWYTSQGSSPEKPIYGAMNLSSIFHGPPEILLEIASFLETHEILKCILISRRSYTLLLPILYRDISLQTNGACASGLETFSQRPDLCKHVKRLSVHPNNATACWPKTIIPISEIRVASMVEKVAHSMCNLSKFEWGGTELPPDDLWTTLKNSCPRLRQISLTAGHESLQLTSELSKLHNLTSFSFHIAPGCKQLIFPNDIFTMLSEHCPNLEELTLRLFSSAVALQESGIFTCVFPNLRALHLDMWSTQSTAESNSVHNLALGTFLSAHPRISSLTILPYTHEPGAALTLLSASAPPLLPSADSRTALTSLSSFVGVPQHVAELPNPAALTTLDMIGAPIPDSKVDIVLVAGALRRLSNLRSLDIRLAHPRLFQAVVDACHKLRTLRVMFPVDFEMKTLKDVSAALIRLPDLREFTLFIGYPPRRRRKDPLMLRCALLLFSDHPGLRNIHLAWFSWALWVRTQNGVYIIREDVCGRRYVDARECGMVRRGRVPLLGGGAGTFERRFRHALDSYPLGKT